MQDNDVPLDQRTFVLVVALRLVFSFRGDPKVSPTPYVEMRTSWCLTHGKARNEIQWCLQALVGMCWLTDSDAQSTVYRSVRLELRLHLHCNFVLGTSSL